MIRQGDQITNPRAGQVMIFLKTSAETNGELLQIDCFSSPTLEREPEHNHPFQQNSFEIISGRCIFRLDGKEQVVGPGQSINIPANVPHYFWNAGDTVYNSAFKYQDDDVLECFKSKPKNKQVKTTKAGSDLLFPC